MNRGRSNEKYQKYKQRSTKHTHTTEDRVMRTPLKWGGLTQVPWKGIQFLLQQLTSISSLFHLFFNQTVFCSIRFRGVFPQINRHAGEVIPHVKSYNQKQPLSIQPIVYNNH